MPIDWASVNWVYVGLLSLFVFASAFVGGILSFNRRFLGALLAAIMFAMLFVFWTYYPHGIALPAPKPV
jgi:phosphoglycerol transferase MdoB-like AlkP superfamily enzyme